MKGHNLYAALMLLLVPLSATMASTRYVALDGDHTQPYDSLATAAQTLQAAAEICEPGDEILVAPGVYTNGGAAAGSSLTNRVVVPNGVALRSIAGATDTIIEGVNPSSSNAVRCVKLGFDASLEGFTIRGGGTRSYLQDIYKAQSGGGVSCEDGAEVIDCIIINNEAYNYGGGVSGGTVRRSVISGNSALRGGGIAFSELDACVVAHNTVSHIGAGVYRSQLRHSTVISNRSAYAGGGVYETDAEDSVIVDNHADWVAPNYKWGVFSNVCTHPAPERGTNNFVDASAAVGRGAGAPQEIIDRVPIYVARKRAESPSRLDRKKAQLGLMDLPPKNKRRKKAGGVKKSVDESVPAVDSDEE
jgi:hypothetical protein